MRLPAVIARGVMAHTNEDLCKDNSALLNHTYLCQIIPFTSLCWRPDEKAAKKKFLSFITSFQILALTYNNSSSVVLFSQEVVEEAHSAGHSQVLKGQCVSMEELQD